MPRDTRTPPLRTEGAFSVSGSTVISAPREEVWKALLDFNSYPQWNPFTRKQLVVDSSGSPHNDPTPTEGKYLSITVHIPPTMGTPGSFGTGSAFCEITVIDRDNYRVAWESAPTLLRPSILLRTERWQILTEGPDGKTKYESFEVFSGPLAYLVKLFVGSGLKLGFEAFADSLKERVESLQAATGVSGL